MSIVASRVHKKSSASRMPLLQRRLLDGADCFGERSSGAPRLLVLVAMMWVLTPVLTFADDGAPAKSDDVSSASAQQGDAPAQQGANTDDSVRSEAPAEASSPSNERDAQLGSEGAIADSSTASSQGKKTSAEGKRQLFRFDLGITIAHDPAASSWGGGAFLEPKFHVLNQLTVGLRFEGVAMFGGSYTPGDDFAEEKVSGNTAAVTSFLAKADYFFTDGTVRPFVAFGLGLYYRASQSLSTGAGVTIDQGVGTHFGVMPQIGVNLGGFRLALNYNVLVGGGTTFRQTLSTTGEEVSSTSRGDYLGIEIGGSIGGNKKRSR